MKLFFTPTTASVFGLDDEFNEDTKRAIVGHEIQEGLDSIMAPYEYLFESADIKFDDIHHPELI